MPNNYLNKPNRNNLFYSEDDFNFEMDLVVGYLEEDTNQTVVVYQVDRAKTQTDNIYKEKRGNVRFKPPVAIPCLYEVKDAELKSYDGKTNNGVYTISGLLTVYVPVTVFDKYSVDIQRGDYLGVPIDTNRTIYYAVTNDGKVNTSNALYVGAYKTAYRVITAAPVDENEFNGK